MIVLAMVLSLFALFVTALAPVISDQIRLITDNAPRWLRELQTNQLVQDLDDRFGLISKAEEYVSSGDFGQQAFGGASAINRHLVIDNGGERPEVLCQNFER